MSTRKVFLAVAPSSAQVKQLIALQANGSGFRQVNPRNFHMTLFYIGPCANRDLDLLYHALDSHRLTKFELTLDQLAFWQQPRIICLTGMLSDPNLINLSKQIDSICRDIGCAKSKYPFNPHITILRKATRLPSLLRDHPIAPLILAPQALHLYHSHSSPQGVQYDILRSWQLS